MHQNHSPAQPLPPPETIGESPTDLQHGYDLTHPPEWAVQRRRCLEDKLHHPVWRSSPPTGRWKLLVSWCHLSAIAQTNPWLMISYPVRRRGLRPDASTGFQNQGLSSSGNGRDKAESLSFLPCETSVNLRSACNWNTKKQIKLVK